MSKYSTVFRIYRQKQIFLILAVAVVSKHRLFIRPGRLGPVHKEHALRRVGDRYLWSLNGDIGKSRQPAIFRVRS